MNSCLSIRNKPAIQLNKLYSSPRAEIPMLFLSLGLLVVLLPGILGSNSICPRAVYRRARPCDFGTSPCPVYEYVGDAYSSSWSWLGRHVCVDLMNDLESCGGCIPGIGGSGRDTARTIAKHLPEQRESEPRAIGKDCTAIPGAEEVMCSRGKCVVLACERGYELVNGECEDVSDVGGEEEDPEKDGEDEEDDTAVGPLDVEAMALLMEEIWLD